MEFETLHDAPIEPVSLVALLTGAGEELHDRSGELVSGRELVLFERCQAGDELLVGLSGTGASQIIEVGVRVSLEGVGVDPGDPPWSWEALTDDGWRRVDLIDDSTGGLQRDGAIGSACPTTCGPTPSTSLGHGGAGQDRRGVSGSDHVSSSPASQHRGRSCRCVCTSRHGSLPRHFLGTGSGHPGCRCGPPRAPAPRTGDERVVVEWTDGERQESPRCRTSVTLDPTTAT